MDLLKNERVKVINKDTSVMATGWVGTSGTCPPGFCLAFFPGLGQDPSGMRVFRNKGEGQRVDQVVLVSTTHSRGKDILFSILGKIKRNKKQRSL